MSNLFIAYNTKADELVELITQYQLEHFKAEMDFETCKNVLLWLNKSVLHMGNYDGSDVQDALTLLKRGYKTEKGINCLSLSIVLCECLLALGVRARVVYMMPKEVEDGDNHVVVEAYISEWKKWIMLDATYGSFCEDEAGKVLNLGELQKAIQNNEKYIFSENLNYNGETDLDVDDIRDYYAKNVFFFRCKSVQGYGVHREHGNMLEIAPDGFDVHYRMVENLKYRIREYGSCEFFTKWLDYESELKNTYISLEEFYK